MNFQTNRYSMLYQGVTVDTGDDIFLKGTIELPNNNPDTNDIGKYFSGISISYEEWNKIAADLQKDDRIAFDLKVDNTIKESALEIFSSSSKAGLVRGRSSEKVAAAAIYTACRMEKVPRTLDEVADKTSLNRNELSRLHRVITRKLKLKISITNTVNLLPRFSEKLALNRNIEIYAQDIINTVESSDYRQGISPAALLGAALYLSCKKYKVRRSQLEIAKAVGTSEVTLRNRAKEIIKLI